MRCSAILALAVGLLAASAAHAQYSGMGGGMGGAGGYGGGGYGGGGGFNGGPVNGPGMGSRLQNPQNYPGYQRPDNNVDPYRRVPSNSVDAYDPFNPAQRGRPQPIPTGPEYVTVVEYYCESCNQKVSSSAQPGQRCPHCGVLWSTGPGSSNSGSSSSGMHWSSSSSRSMGKLIGAAIAGLLALCGMIWRAAAGGSSPSSGASVPHKQSPPPNFSGLSPSPPPTAPGESIAEIKRRLRPGNPDRGIS